MSCLAAALYYGKVLLERKLIEMEEQAMTQYMTQLKCVPVPPCPHAQRPSVWRCAHPPLPLPDPRRQQQHFGSNQRTCDMTGV